jgi:hypothetical protein
VLLYILHASSSISLQVKKVSRKKFKWVENYFSDLTEKAVEKVLSELNFETPSHSHVYPRLCPGPNLTCLQARSCFEQPIPCLENVKSVLGRFWFFFQSCNQWSVLHWLHVGVGLMAYRYGTESVVNGKTWDLFYLLTLHQHGLQNLTDAVVLPRRPRNKSGLLTHSVKTDNILRLNRVIDLTDLKNDRQQNAKMANQWTALMCNFYLPFSAFHFKVCIYFFTRF